MATVPTRLALLAFLVSCLAAAPLPARAADDAMLERLATCQDSWYDWKNDDAHMARYAGFIETQFAAGSDPGGFAPKARMTAFGQPVTQVFPQSVGMGVGFSLVVSAPFARVRQVLEKQLGRALQCTSGDGMRACELPLGERKNVVLMAPLAPDSASTLMGCYYFYEK